MAILAIDQGTTSTKVYLWRNGRLQHVGSRPHQQIYPRAGWVEHDPEELVGNIADLVRTAGPATAAGLANQGETVVAWDARTKRPLYNAIVWQDGRTAEEIQRLQADGFEEMTLARAGLPLDAYFSATKLRWLLDHADGARDLLRQGRLRLGTSDAFFLDRLTGVCATDPSTASRTSLMHLHDLRWDEDLCNTFGVPMECLPEIRPTTGDFGTLANIPILASVVDQQASLFGHGCQTHGDIKITFGTGAFALGISGDHPSSAHTSGLLSTCAWQLDGRPAQYALDGGVLTAGAAVEWLGRTGLLHDVDTLGSFTGPAAIERGLAFVPALAGLGSPHWDRDARGTWLGLDLSTSRDDLCRAVLEGIALRAAEIVVMLSGALGGTHRIAIDGGLTQSDYFVNFLADALARPVHVAGSADMTSIGVLSLCLAALGRDEQPDAVGLRIVGPRKPLAAAQHALFEEAVALSRDWGKSSRESRYPGVAAPGTLVPNDRKPHD
jgi:glycerol kinase